MHACDLGCTCRICKVIFIFKGFRDNVIPEDVIKEINQTYIDLYQWTPKEISRKPRDILKEFFFLKAVEFKNLALYFGIVIFRHLKTDQYHHFLLYCLALRLYADIHSTFADHDIAHALMTIFVKNFTGII